MFRSLKQYCFEWYHWDAEHEFIYLCILKSGFPCSLRSTSVFPLSCGWSVLCLGDTIVICRFMIEAWTIGLFPLVGVMFCRELLWSISVEIFSYPILSTFFAGLPPFGLPSHSPLSFFLRFLSLPPSLSPSLSLSSRSRYFYHYEVSDIRGVGRSREE